MKLLTLLVFALPALAQPGDAILKNLQTSLARFKSHPIAQAAEAAPELTPIKHQLRDWVEAQLAASSADFDPEALSARLNGMLQTAGLVEDTNDNQDVRGAVRVRISRDGALLRVITSVGVICEFDDLRTPTATRTAAGGASGSSSRRTIPRNTTPPRTSAKSILWPTIGMARNPAHPIYCCSPTTGAVPPPGIPPTSGYSAWMPRAPNFSSRIQKSPGCDDWASSKAASATLARTRTIQWTSSSNSRSVASICSSTTATPSATT